MARQMSLVGGARINPQGEFEITTGKGQNQTSMVDCPVKTYTKDFFDFLTSPDPSRQIGGSIVTKSITRNGLPTVAFGFLEPAFKVSLFLKQPGYAVFVLELPFPLGTDGAGFQNEAPDGSNDDEDVSGAEY